MKLDKDNKILKLIVIPLCGYFLSILVVFYIWGFNMKEAPYVVMMGTATTIIVGLPVYVITKTFSKAYLLTIFISISSLVIIGVIHSILTGEFLESLVWAPLAIFFMTLGFLIISPSILLLIKNILNLINFRNRKYD